MRITTRAIRWAITFSMIAVVAMPSVAAAGDAPPKRGRNFSGAVDVGGGRQIYAECRGKGSPTVVLIAGKGNGAEDWQQVLDADDPAHDAPGDDLPFSPEGLHRSRRAVFPSVARFTRVCTYDRPDVRFDGDDLTTPREQPHTVDADVNDLAALLTALDEPGPYVLVAHSYGGLIANLYARTHPDRVAGLVMVDTVSELLEDVTSPARLTNWDAANSATSPESREGVEIIDAFAKINAAGPLPKVPAVVLSADKPWRIDLLPEEAKQVDTVTFDDWLASVDRLADALDAKHITKTNSGHAIYLYSPKIVVDAIHEVVDDARADGRCASTRAKVERSSVGSPWRSSAPTSVGSTARQCVSEKIEMTSVTSGLVDHVHQDPPEVDGADPERWDCREVAERVEPTDRVATSIAG